MSDEEIKKQEQEIETTKGFIEDRLRTINKLDELLEERKKYRDEQVTVLQGYYSRLRMQENRLDEIKLRQADKALDKYHFKCEGCGKTHKESIYCIAQRASGRSMTHTCDCGHKTHLEPYKK